jgi:hypothetical protein
MANKSLQATRDGRSSSAVAVHVIRSRVPELWTFGKMSGQHFMKHILLALMAVALIGCQKAQPVAHEDMATPAGVSYAGGDGSSIEQAVIIKGATESTGVHAEYVWIAQRYPGYRRGLQSLRESGGKQYDVLEFTTASGEKKCVYFDITDFYGKL